MRCRDEALLRLLSYEYDECGICGVTRSLHLHHVVFRSQLGDDVRGNIVALCVDCHEGYHRGRAWQKRMLAEHIRAERPDVTSYLQQKLGDGAAEHWFAVHLEGYSED